MRSRRIVAVDTDIRGGEVTGPEADLARAAFERELAGRFPLALESLGESRVVEGNGCPIHEDRDAVERERQFILLKGDARTARSRDDPAPVRIVSPDGDLRQRGCRLPLERCSRLFAVAAAFDVDRDQVGRPFAVLGNLAGERLADIADQPGEVGQR